MALKALMLRKKLDAARGQLETLKKTADELAKREAELESDVAEAQTEEERQAVEEAITAFEADKSANDEAQTKLSGEISELERELEETESKANTPTPSADPEVRTGKEINAMGFTTTRARELFGKMDAQSRSAMFASERVKSFMGDIRNCIKEKRALSNVGVLIPDEFIGFIRENIIRYSKLYKHVNVRSLKGNGRMTIMGTIPEAVWTEACAALNELDLSFNDVEVDGYKVGGYIAVCNATLEDSDIDLAAEIISAIGQAIGIALDKAILFGTGTKMPLGVVTRLTQTAAPANPPATARPWTDLHTSNVVSIAGNVTGANFFKQFVLSSGAAKGKYSRGEKVWTMNETTYTALMAEILTINSSGAVVAAINNTMPVVGGTIEILEFIPDNYIIGGYFDLFTLAERAGQRIGQSEHYRFLEDQTVFKGTARYDGVPVIAEGFVAIGIKGTTVSASAVSFAPDNANTVESGEDEDNE